MCTRNLQAEKATETQEWAYTPIKTSDILIESNRKRRSDQIEKQNKTQLFKEFPPSSSLASVHNVCPEGFHNWYGSISFCLLFSFPNGHFSAFILSLPYYNFLCVYIYIYIFSCLFIFNLYYYVLHVSWKICRFFSSQFDIPWILVRKISLLIKFNILIAKQDSFFKFYVYCLCRSVISLFSHLVLLWHSHSFTFWHSSICLHFSSD